MNHLFLKKSKKLVFTVLVTGFFFVVTSHVALAGPIESKPYQPRRPEPRVHHPPPAPPPGPVDILHTNPFGPSQRDRPNPPLLLPNVNVGHALRGIQGETRESKTLKDSDFDEKGQLLTSVGDSVGELLVQFSDSPVLRKTIRVQMDRGPPQGRWISELAPHLFVNVRNGTRPESLINSLRELPFDQRKLRLISLLDDSKVKETLESLTELKNNIVGMPDPSLEKIEAEFSKHQRNTFVVMGHVGDGHLVASDPTGNVTQLNASLEEIQTSARKYGCEIVFLGCQSASTTQIGIGTGQNINPLDALAQLKAAAQARNCMEFLGKLASPDMDLIIDQSAFEHPTDAASGAEIRFEISSNVLESREPLISGFLVVSSRILLMPTPPISPFPTQINN